jgi:hypothetical protein
MTSPGMQITYGVLSIIGVVVTWYFNLQPESIGNINAISHPESDRST